MLADASEIMAATSLAQVGKSRSMVNLNPEVFLAKESEAQITHPSFLLLFLQMLCLFALLVAIVVISRLLPSEVGGETADASTFHQSPKLHGQGPRSIGMDHAFREPRTSSASVSLTDHTLQDQTSALVAGFRRERIDTLRFGSGFPSVPPLNLSQSMHVPRAAAEENQFSDIQGSSSSDHAFQLPLTSPLVTGSQRDQIETLKSDTRIPWAPPLNLSQSMHLQQKAADENKFLDAPRDSSLDHAFQVPQTSALATGSQSEPLKSATRFPSVPPLSLSQSLHLPRTAAENQFADIPATRSSLNSDLDSLPGLVLVPSSVPPSSSQSPHKSSKLAQIPDFEMRTHTKDRLNVRMPMTRSLSPRLSTKSDLTEDYFPFIGEDALPGGSTPDFGPLPHLTSPMQPLIRRPYLRPPVTKAKSAPQVEWFNLATPRQGSHSRAQMK